MLIGGLGLVLSFVMLGMGRGGRKSGRQTTVLNETARPVMTTEVREEVR